ncbi:MAG: hypothetical protein DRI79_06130 [Chloroflexi bacterium]|nr:MAG: hypothetical protein DRI80_08840 [Chloroflexota bacterium]RLC89765.1 MAG: hypothetical protein DRI79_06130 [Chloroflexota bacterium]HEY67197.1 hypothetical protein [Thermoflexia bacterium]
MAHPIRPLVTFVLRLWREPGDHVGDAGWRGLIRSLGTDAAKASENEVVFRGLNNLPAALRPLLMDEETSPTEVGAPEEP